LTKGKEFARMLAIGLQPADETFIIRGR
jgi:hypothetical protein